MDITSEEIHKIPETHNTNLISKCPYKLCNNLGCKRSWHYPCQLTKNGTTGFIKALRPMVFMIDTAEIFVGITLLITIALYARNYDKLFGTEDSKVISSSALYGLFALISTALTLFLALVLNIRRMLWIYILFSSILSVYTFVLAVVKIHFALLVLERDTNELKFDKTQYILNNGCMFGILTLLASGHKSGESDSDEFLTTIHNDDYISQIHGCLYIPTSTD